MILTNIFNFNNKVATMDPMQVLVTPLPSGIHYRKRITITASSYAGSHIIPIFLCGGGPTILTKAWRLLQSRKKYAPLPTAPSPPGMAISLRTSFL